ncbi:MAG: PilN domain-containing protein [Stellaceae bacterium]
MFQVDRILDWQRGIEPALRGALRWWLGELASFAPAGLRRRIAGPRSRLLLVRDPVGTALVLENGDQRQGLGPVDLASARSVQRALAAAPQGLNRRSANVVLCVPAGGALRTIVTLPLAAERNLDQVIGFELERLVPFKREAAYYAHRVVARSKTARNLHTELTVVPRAEIDAMAQAAQRVGLHATGIEIAGASPGDPAAFIPLEGAPRAAAHSHARIALASLAGLVTLLGIAAIVIPLVKVERARGALGAEVAEARHGAEASLDLQKQIEAQRRDQRVLVDRRRKTPAVTELLDIITRLTPDNTFLTELQIGNDEVRLIGASTSATALLGLVDQSPSFRNAAFRSPITQDPKLNRERFDISAKIAPRGAP